MRIRSLLVPVSPGELCDKLTILRIKAIRLTDEAKNANVHAELKLLEAVIASDVPASAELDALICRLSAVNESLWDVEDEIRRHERRQDFGSTFIQLARSVYRQNDERARIKRQINELLGSTLIEEKQYADYMR